MTRSDRDRVLDIVEAAQEVVGLVADGKTAWDADRVKRLAVERLLEMIGESARAMTEAGRSRYDGVPWNDIVGLRTVLAHHYHRIDPDQVWVIASVQVPSLLRQLERED